MAIRRDEGTCDMMGYYLKCRLYEDDGISFMCSYAPNRIHECPHNIDKLTGKLAFTKY